MSKPLFSFGTSRGGTTFFARILSVNPDIKVAGDTFLPIYRAFRNRIMRKKIDANFDCSCALDDYYFSEQKLQNMKAIQDSSLNIAFPQNELKELQARLFERLDLAAKELKSAVKEIKGKNFLDLFKAGLSAIEKAYQAKDISWSGAHDNWAIEFLPVLAKAFPKAKFISLIRDPRAAIASTLKNRQTEPELVPLIYSYANHWCKHAAFSWKLINDNKFKNKILLVRYEDLVTAPEKEIKKICKFLQVKYNPAMLVPNNFRPIEGDKWQTYSNFKVPKNKIYKNSINSWKKYLPKGTVEFIEFICQPEMRLFKYQPQEYQSGFPSHEIMKFFIKDDKIAQGWRGNHQSWDKECAYHLFKNQALTKTGDLLDKKTIEKYFLFPEVYNASKNL